MMATWHDGTELAKIMEDFGFPFVWLLTSHLILWNDLNWNWISFSTSDRLLIVVFKMLLRSLKPSLHVWYWSSWLFFRTTLLPKEVIRSQQDSEYDLVFFRFFRDSLKQPAACTHSHWRFLHSFLQKAVVTNVLFITRSELWASRAVKINDGKQTILNNLLEQKVCVNLCISKKLIKFVWFLNKK